MKHNCINWLLLLIAALTSSHGFSQGASRESELLRPFFNGVASGDPLEDRVIIWSRYSPDSLDGNQPVPITYTLATDTAFKNVITKGVLFADPLNDYTLKQDVVGLSPNTYYYYVFTDPRGRNSLIGRTKTTATGDYAHFRAAVLSCTSIYSGYFNGYARISERNDLDAVIHVGDYVYDFVDGNGNNRVPTPFPEVPVNLQEWRARHYYYELDPDLIRARQQHPFIVVWDNHDVDDYGTDPTRFVASNRAFFEWIPMRLQQPELIDTLKIYRKVSFGNLADLYMLDVYSYKDKVEAMQAFNINNTEMDNDTSTYLGDKQFEWLMNEIKTSTAKWRIFGSQKFMSPWCLSCIPDLDNGTYNIPELNDQGNLFNPAAWDGYVGERRKIFNQLRQFHPKDNVVVSGDAHLAFWSDLTEDPFNPLAYNVLTGGNSVGVEMLPSSLTRENLNEILEGAGSGKPAAYYDSATAVLSTASLVANPHHVYDNFKDHGYGILDITADRVIGEFWVSEKITPETGETFAKGFTSAAGGGKWSRLPNTSPAPSKSASSPLAPSNPPTGAITSVTAKVEPVPLFTVYPNPAKDQLTVEWIGSIQGTEDYTLELLDVYGRLVWQAKLETSKVQLNRPEQQSGVYFIRITGNGKSTIRKVVWK